MTDSSLADPGDSVDFVPRPTLRQRAVRGAAWIAAGIVARQLLKLGSSLILTRLLFPQAIGLMATLGLLMALVEMCSDFGLRQAIIQHPHGGRRRELDTAWSLMFARGLVLTVVVAALAWPFSWFFGEPQLFPLALVFAITPTLRGLASPAMLRWNRELDQARLTATELTGEAVRIGASIVGALLTHSVWGLLIGSIVGEATRSVTTYLLGGERPRWRVNAAVARELLTFGRFVFLSSLIGFFALRLDAAFVTKYLGMEAAGLYYIAGVFAMMLDQLGTSVAAQVLFPAIAQRQNQPEIVRARLGEVLDGVMLLLAGCVCLALSADMLIETLYDPRYLPAAEPLRWLLIAGGISTLANTLNGPLMAFGQPQHGTLATLVRLIVFCLCAPPLGAHFAAAGYAGAVTLSTAAFAVMIAIPACRRGHVDPLRLLRGLAIPAGFALALLGLRAAFAGNPPSHVVWTAIDVTLLAGLVYLYRDRVLRLLGRGVRQP